MATQSQLVEPATVEDTSNSEHKPDGGDTAQDGPEGDLAWEIVKEECHDILEQLPLTLQRNFSLMRDLDEQVAAHLQAIPAVLQDYLSLRMKLAQDVVMVDSTANDAVEHQRSPTHDLQKRASRAASFSSASLTPITESPPSTRSLSPRQIHDESPIEEDEEDDDGEETEDVDTSLETQESALTAPKSIELIKRVATLATDAVRGSLEKVNLSNAAFAAIDRHVRALDIAIAEQESAVAVGIRPGTRPAAIAGPNGSTTSPTNMHRHSQSFESNGLLALAEVASVFQAAEKTLESIQPPASAISTVLTSNVEKEETVDDKLARKPSARPKPKPKVEPKVAGGKTKRPQQSKEKKGKKGGAQNGALEDEPTYCYCEKVSFGKMIACDAPNCKREWFHWECVGITRAPPATAKWYCRECEVQEPAKKRRKR